MIVESGLRTPADVQGGINVGQRPLHDFAEFIPVVHLFKRHLFHRRAGDDQTVKPLAADFVKGFIEFEQVLAGGVFGNVTAHLQQFNIALDGRVAEQAQQLGFGLNLFRHQVEDGDVQRTNILAVSALLIHDKDVFFLKNSRGRQCGGYIDRHWDGSSLSGVVTCYLLWHNAGNASIIKMEKPRFGPAGFFCT